MNIVNNMPVEFTKEEITVLLAYIDVAVKHYGLQQAGNALQLSTKLQNALPKEEPKQE